MPRAREARLLFADCSRRGAGLAAPGSDPGGDLAPPDDDRALLLTPLRQALHALFSGRCCSWRGLRARAVGCPSDCPRRVSTAMEPRVEAASTPRGQPEEQIGGWLPPGGRNPLHYDGGSSPWGARSGVLLRVLGHPRGVDTGGWTRSAGRPGGRNPLHYNGVSPPRGASSDVFFTHSRPGRGHWGVEQIVGPPRGSQSAAL